ncbi:hypothetical protein Tco_0703660 [Tanacetum coccineum]|uniref:Reverse transcriptase domain-containing protein n=1 Tax=Tanacetum coccineum TaxID=301880 RepID=A0ABQ4Y001_9ASTR
MRTRNSNFPNNSTVTIPRRRNKRRAPNVVEPELRTIVEVAPMAEQTMEKLLRAPTEGYGEAIVIPEINADHFEIKTNLLQLVQASPFHGFERDNPHTHINNFKRITSTLKFRDVPNDVIKLMMFPYSLEGAARVCEAWELFKEMLRACPHHGFTELTQIDTFYNSLNDSDQDSLNAAAGGNLLSKTTREALNIIEDKSKVRYSRNKSNVSRMNTTSRESFSKTDERIDKLADQISTLVEIVSKKVVTPSTVKAVRNLVLLVVVLMLDLLMNKEKLLELAKISLNENCSAMLLKKLLEKLGDPDKFLIQCDFPGMDPIISDSFLSITPFEESDFILEEIEAFLKDDSISPEIDHADCDPEGDICLIEKLLNNDPFQLPPMDLKEVTKAKPSIEEPLELELKDLPSHLEYAYLEENDKLPVIIAKSLKDDEKEALLKVLKSHKRAIT